MKLILVIGFLIVGAKSFAEVSIDDGISKTLFKVDGKIVSPIEAAKAAPTNEIERCTPIKGALNLNGQEMTAYKCKAVKLEYSLRTGAPHWKSK